MTLQKTARLHLSDLVQRLSRESRQLIQVLVGPRQVGKTTLSLQVIQQLTSPHVYVSTDNVTSKANEWIGLQWESVRLRLKQENAKEYVLVIDEIQKLDNWSEAIKAEWDYDTIHNIPIKVMILGSSRLMLQQGLSESLAGRFETTYVGHWSYPEMKASFGLGLDEFIWFGGYPGSMHLIAEEDRWKQYIVSAFIEASINRDIILLTRIDKPALMRRLFELGCSYSGHILSFNKILGQLLDAGNTTTLSNYLRLLDTAGLLGGLEKYAPDKIRQRASSPKFQVYNTALLSALQPLDFGQVRTNLPMWGHWVESAVGAHLINAAWSKGFKLYFWREANYEVDFVLTYKGKTVAIEVKSGPTKITRGLDAFKKKYNPYKSLLVGKNGFPIEDFLLLDPIMLFD
ncbi:MAG: ATP-binding protein [Bacteroidetes bacterium]|nr:ATP-binding protein [Bacteroidota bacterium]